MQPATKKKNCKSSSVRDVGLGLATGDLDP